MEVSKYIMLFHKKLKGEINSQEQEELSDWLQQENRRGFTEGLDKTWNLSKRYKQGYEPDVDAGLARLQQRMAAARKTEPSRVLQPLRTRRRSYRWLSAAAAIALLAAIGWWWLDHGNAGSEPNALIYTTGSGESEEALLPDGSTVVLNENSFLSVNPEFQNASERLVELVGEAYFKVTPNPSRPFRIATSDAMVEVLGTAFNLRSYPEEGFTEVEVEEGSVRLSGLDNENAIQLAPGQRGICRPGTAMNAKDSPGLNAQSWRTHRLQ
ncbi:MAG: FecR domain-containing protein, partial [Phaeodactylibacter sp.]|nr:FecR domain-containing protein [Phaeodactylibacter sp.]